MNSSFCTGWGAVALGPLTTFYIRKRSVSVSVSIWAPEIWKTMMLCLMILEVKKKNLNHDTDPQVQWLCFAASHSNQVTNSHGLLHTDTLRPCVCREDPHASPPPTPMPPSWCPHLPNLLPFDPEVDEPRWSETDASQTQLIHYI